jgi:hypothetical protein
LKSPPIDNDLPHLFYTNAKINEHNKTIFQNTCIGSNIHISCKINSFKKMSFSLQIASDTKPNNWLPPLINNFKNMLIELCEGNYVTLNDLVNVVEFFFEDYTITLSQSFIWMHFQNPQIEINTRFENSHTYKTIFRLDIKCTPVEQKIVEIQIGSNLIHITTKIQFPIQVVIESIFIIRVPKRMV